MEKKMTWKKTCPICGSRHTDRFEDAYWGMCRECGFNSMASESLEQAMEAWNKGYLDIEDKAKHEGISKFTHDELLDLWWYEVGMEGCTDMGMQPEEVDQYWDEHPQDLKENMKLMWDHLGNIWGW